MRAAETPIDSAQPCAATTSCCGASRFRTDPSSPSTPPRLRPTCTHPSALDEFFLASDSIVHSYRGAYMNRIGGVIDQVPPEHVAELHDEGSTIGGYLLFPGDRRDRKPTINGARRMNAKISVA
jgi:hypothetical protein